MAAQGKAGGSWLKYSCLGCLGILAFVILIVVGVAGIALMQVRSEEIAETTLSPSLPAPPPVAPPPDGTAPPPAPQPETGTSRALPAGRGKVLLDLAGGEFVVEPALPGETLHVEAVYDKTSYRLEEVLEAPEEGPWTYQVRFRRTGSSGFMGFIRALMGANTPRVRVLLPRDVPMELDTRIGQGGAEVEIGGLWITSAAIRFQQGGLSLAISEPLREPMERLELNGGMGGFATRSLGNASPRSLEVDFRMGGMDLDLRGAWRNDADIRIDASMGGGSVRLPRDAVILGLEGQSLRRPEMKSTPELPLPTLRFAVTTSMGEVEFR